jgi:L-ornithine N5-monooxygenase
MVENINADAVVFASGYRPNDPMRIPGNIRRFCNLDADGRPQVGLDYRLETSVDIDCGIYLQGLTEHTHRLSSSLLSNIAVRAGHIVESVTKSR